MNSHVSTIDKWRKYNGPCGLCGHWDQRHRIIDTVRGRVKADGKVAEVAEDYDLPVKVVEAIVSCRIDKRRYKEVLKWVSIGLNPNYRRR